VAELNIRFHTLMAILQEVTGDYERVDALVNILIDRATGGDCSEGDFIELRSYFASHTELSTLLPRWFAGKRSVNQFWQFIKIQYSTYAERREFLWTEFEPLLQHCETGSAIPAEDDIAGALKTLNSESVERVWRKTLYRLPEDPDGAITVARTLVETVCKHILEDLNIPFDEKKTDLPALYKLVANELNLAPQQHEEQVFKQILGGCASVVGGLGSMRNKLGDAHGHGRNRVRPAKRHASLAANLGGTMALYLLETYNAKKT